MNIEKLTKLRDYIEKRGPDHFSMEQWLSNHAKIDAEGKLIFESICGTAACIGGTAFLYLLENEPAALAPEPIENRLRTCGVYYIDIDEISTVNHWLEMSSEDHFTELFLPNEISLSDPFEEEVDLWEINYHMALELLDRIIDGTVDLDTEFAIHDEWLDIIDLERQLEE